MEIAREVVSNKTMNIIDISKLQKLMLGWSNQSWELVMKSAVVRLFGKW